MSYNCEMMVAFSLLFIDKEEYTSCLVADLLYRVQIDIIGTSCERGISVCFFFLRFVSFISYSYFSVLTQTNPSTLT
jgi:hypothetical protein